MHMASEESNHQDSHASQWNTQGDRQSVCQLQ